MRRQASDNRYLHPDFHGALSVAIDYLEAHFGQPSVRQYLWQFATAFYAPLTDDLRRRGLVALKEHFAGIYQLEGASPRFRLTEEELWIELDRCPAVAHMRRSGYPVARLFHETTRTVNEAICEGTQFAAELVEYDDKTGRSVQRFFRRPA
jgi:hypothetical protein